MANDHNTHALPAEIIRPDDCPELPIQSYVQRTRLEGFVLLGAAATMVGYYLQQYKRVLGMVGGVIIIVLGGARQRLVGRPHGRVAHRRASDGARQPRALPTLEVGAHSARDVCGD